MFLVPNIYLNLENTLFLCNLRSTRYTHPSLKLKLGSKQSASALCLKEGTFRRFQVRLGFGFSWNRDLSWVTCLAQILSIVEW